QDRKELAGLIRAANTYPIALAGQKAAELLACHFFDRGERSLAVDYFERALMKRGIREWNPVGLVKATILFRAIGAKAHAPDTWRMLRVLAENEMLSFGLLVFSLDELDKAINQLAAQQPEPGRRVTPVFRGDPSRVNQGVGGRAFLVADWTQDTIR